MMRARTLAFLATLSVVSAASPMAQTTDIRKALVGEWSGTLALDNSAPRITLVFENADSTLSGKAYSDGSMFGPMENLSLKGDTVHFNVDRLDFTGTIAGAIMKVDLIVYNGSHRALTLRKTPELHPPTSGSLREHVLYDSSFHRSQRTSTYTPAS
jgi:hypothetical protein